MSGAERDGLLLAALSRLEVGQGRLEAGQAGLAAGVTTLGAGLTTLEAGLTALEGRLTALEGRLTALEGGSAGLEAGQAGLKAGLARLETNQTELRTTIMARMDRLQDAMTAIRDDIAVNFGAADAVRTANLNTRNEVHALSDLVSAMQRQIQRLQTEMREIKGDP